MDQNTVKDEIVVTALACNECGQRDDTVSYDFHYNLLLCDQCFDKLTDHE